MAMKPRFLRRVVSKIAEKVGLDPERVPSLSDWLEPTERPSESVPPPAPASEPPPAQAPEKKEEKTPKTGSSEPIATRTMARLYASQGHVPRAIAIFEQLRDEEPADPTLDAELEALRREPRVPEPAEVAPAKESPEPRAWASVEAASADMVVSAAIDPTTIRIAWEIAEASVIRARAFLDPGATRALRVVCVVTAEDGHVKTTTADHRDVALSGTQAIAALPAGASVFAAYGVEKNGRFHAIAHASAVRLPYDRPSKVWARGIVSLPPTFTDLAAPSSPSETRFSRQDPADLGDLLRRSASAGPVSLQAEIERGETVIRGAASSEEQAGS